LPIFDGPAIVRAILRIGTFVAVVVVGALIIQKGLTWFQRYPVITVIVVLAIVAVCTVLAIKGRRCPTRV
jgi:hypothetical protein